jgi:hypothetical protein
MGIVAPDDRGLIAAALCDVDRHAPLWRAVGDGAPLPSNAAGPRQSNHAPNRGHLVEICKRALLLSEAADSSIGAVRQRFSLS